MKLESKQSLNQLISSLDKFPESEILKALRGDANVGLRRKAKSLALKLSSAAIKSGMEALQVQPVKTQTGDKQTEGWIKVIKGGKQ